MIHDKKITHWIMVARFFLAQYVYQNGENMYTKLPTNYQMVIKYTNWLQYIPNGHGIYQPFPFQGRPKFTQIGTFGLKICHLATLHWIRDFS
jgi:hypothetical protein